jgi:hypothetical protein
LKITKGGLETITQHLAMEYAKDGAMLDRKMEQLVAKAIQ